MTSPFETLLEPARAELCRRFGLRSFALGPEQAPAPSAPSRALAVAPEGEAVPLEADALLAQGELRPLIPLPSLEAVRASARLPAKPGPIRDVLTFRFEAEPGAAPDFEVLAQYVLYLLCWRPPELRVAGGGREATFRCGALMLDLELYRRFRREQGVADFAREARLFLPTVEVERWTAQGGLLTVAFRCAGGAVESALGLLAAVASEPLAVDEVHLERLDKPGSGGTRLVAELMAPTAVEGTLTGAERELFVPLLRPVLFPSFAGLYRELLEEGIYVGPVRLEERREPDAPVAHGSFLFDRAFEPHRFEIAYRDELLEGAPDARAAIAGPEGFEQILLRANGCTYRIDASDVWRWPPALVKRLLDRLVSSDRPFSPSPVAAPARIRSLRATAGGQDAPVKVRANAAAPWQPFAGMRAARGDSVVWLHAPGSLNGPQPVRLELALEKPTWLLTPRGAEAILVDLSELELKALGGAVQVDPNGFAALQRERTFTRGEAPPITLSAEGWRLEARIVADPERPAPPLAPIQLIHVAYEPPPNAAFLGHSGHGSPDAQALPAWGSLSPEQSWFVDPAVNSANAAPAELLPPVAAPADPAPPPLDAPPLDSPPLDSPPLDSPPNGAEPAAAVGPSTEDMLETLEDAILEALPPLPAAVPPPAPLGDAAPSPATAAPSNLASADLVLADLVSLDPTPAPSEPPLPAVEPPLAPLVPAIGPLVGPPVEPPAGGPVDPPVASPFSGASPAMQGEPLEGLSPREPEPPTVVALIGVPAPHSAASSKTLALHLEDLDAQNPASRLLACTALPLDQGGLGLGPDGAILWKSEAADWTLGTVGGRVVLRSQSKGASRLQWTGEGGSRSLRAGETARLRSGDLVEYAGRRWRVHARGEAKEVAPPAPLAPQEPVSPPRAEPLEVSLLTQGRGAAVHAVAIPGGKLGLAIGPDGSVLWQTRDPGAFRIWVGVDGRLILLRPPVAPPVKLVRGRRWLEVPTKKPVVLLDGDELDTGGARVRLRVVGRAAEVRPPWTEELLAESDEITPVDPPFSRRATPQPPVQAAGLGPELEGSREQDASGAVTLAHFPAVPLRDAGALATPVEIPAVDCPWPERSDAEKTKP